MYFPRHKITQAVKGFENELEQTLGLDMPYSQDSWSVYKTCHPYLTSTIVCQTWKEYEKRIETVWQQHIASYHKVNATGFPNI